MLPHIFGSKVQAGYVSFADAVISEASTIKAGKMAAGEGEVTISEEDAALHEKKKKVARLMISTAPIFDEFIKNDFINQGFDDTTDQNDINNRLSALATNLVALGFGD